MADYFIGVDGGGTKTAGVLVDRASNVLARTRKGSTNYHAVGVAAASQCLHELIQSLLDAVNLDASAITGIGLGISGVSTDSDRSLVAGWVQRLLPTSICIVENDAVIGLAAATAGNLYGVVVVSGTGMIVLGFSRSGERTRAGGWGPLIGEPGGGFAIGAAGLRAIAEAEDGLGLPTRLTPAVLEYLGVASPREMVAWVYADYTWARIAALAPLVVQAANLGDVVAKRILEDSGRALSEAVIVVVHRLGLYAEDFPCVLIGGNLAPGPLADCLQTHLRDHLPTARLIRPEVEPALGAALLVMRQTNA